MSFRQRLVSIRVVAAGAEFFCLLFVHGEEFFMNFIMRQFDSRFRRGQGEKYQNASPHCHKEDVVEEGILFFVIRCIHAGKDNT